MERGSPRPPGDGEAAEQSVFGSSRQKIEARANSNLSREESGSDPDFLEERGWTREQAYVLCSVAVDLRVSNVVDVPNVTVSALLPEDIFQN